MQGEPNHQASHPNQKMAIQYNGESSPSVMERSTLTQVM